MPQQRGKWHEVLADKKKVKQFKSLFHKLSTAEMKQRFGITNYDYEMIRDKLKLRKRVFKKRQGIAKFFDWEPLDPTIMDFGIIMTWGTKRR